MEEVERELENFRVGCSDLLHMVQAQQENLDGQYKRLEALETRFANLDCDAVAHADFKSALDRIAALEKVQKPPSLTEIVSMADFNERLKKVENEQRLLLAAWRDSELDNRVENLEVVLQRQRSHYEDENGWELCQFADAEQYQTRIRSAPHCRGEWTDWVDGKPAMYMDGYDYRFRKRRKPDQRRCEDYGILQSTVLDLKGILTEALRWWEEDCVSNTWPRNSWVPAAKVALQKCAKQQQPEEDGPYRCLECGAEFTTPRMGEEVPLCPMCCTDNITDKPQEDCCAKREWYCKRVDTVEGEKPHFFILCKHCQGLAPNILLSELVMVKGNRTHARRLWDQEAQKGNAEVYRCGRFVPVEEFVDHAVLAEKKHLEFLRIPLQDGKLPELEEDKHPIHPEQPTSDGPDSSMHGNLSELGAFDVQAELDDIAKMPEDKPTLCKHCGEDSPWPPRDVVAKLVEAADILLTHYDYDSTGHEVIREAVVKAGAWLGATPAEGGE